ncbi:hypothetical protein CRG98_008292 [Punica granatum]|uniref:Uncharacterized protein n=1 Tax=Punica granatum TaxID=22663 RepID=A0A2I0KS38_PUNGR|nr:hypothetical protein CRG98_008292 [Punica granatum]
MELVVGGSMMAISSTIIEERLTLTLEIAYVRAEIRVTATEIIRNLSRETHHFGVGVPPLSDQSLSFIMRDHGEGFVNIHQGIHAQDLRPNSRKFGIEPDKELMNLLLHLVSNELDTNVANASRQIKL